MIEEVKKLMFNNIRIVGYEITGCSECPFSSEHSDINYADPDEGYYNCSLLRKEKLWGEDPICSDKDWQGYASQLFEPKPDEGRLLTPDVIDKIIFKASEMLIVLSKKPEEYNQEEFVTFGKTTLKELLEAQRDLTAKQVRSPK